MSTVIITGCSSGFGLQAALSFARNGDTVYASMRDTSRAAALKQAANDENLIINIRTLDVTKSQTFTEFFQNVVDETGQIDVLVNNAGMLRAGALEDLSEDLIRDVIETNLIGPLFLSRSILPFMRAQNSGYIIMISSLSGIAGLPGDVAYSASKFGLEGATEALRHEVDRWNIKLALVEAGMYATEIMNASLPESKVLPDYYPADSAYRLLVESNLKKQKERMPEAFAPPIVADLLVKIAQSDGSQLRWPADAVAEMVLEKMFAQNDQERDSFLRDVSDTEWWSNGE